MAIWGPVGTASIVTATLTGNSGGVVGVDAFNNIDVVGDGTTIVIAGNPGAHSLTASTAGTVATSYTEDSGTAIPSAGVLQVVGGTGVNTAGSGNTITINAASAVPLTFTEDTGTAVPSANDIIMAGGTGIATSGAGHTVTIATSGIVATSYTEDAGSAIPSVGVLKIVGGTGISTAGAGNTVTITNTSAASIQFNEDSGIATPSAGIVKIVGGSGISTMGDGANKITITAVSSPVTFNVGLQATTSNVTGDGTVYTIIYDTSNFDTTSSFNLGTGTFTAPSTGYYFFTLNISTQNVGAAHTVGVANIGSGLATLQFNPFGQADSTGRGTMAVNNLVHMNSGDTLQTSLQISGGTKTISIGGAASFCYFSGYKLF